MRRVSLRHVSPDETGVGSDVSVNMAVEVAFGDI